MTEMGSTVVVIPGLMRKRSSRRRLKCWFGLEMVVVVWASFLLVLCRKRKSYMVLLM